MRIHHYLLACLIVTGSSNALARGGPGGAFAALLEGLLQIAIIGGLLGGTLCAHFLSRTPWKTIAVLSAALVVVAFMFPFVGICMGISAIVLLAVFLSVSYVARGGLFQTRLATPSPTSMDGKPQESETRSARHVLHWIAGTYVFWAAVSLINFELLGFFAIPPAILFFSKVIGHFLPFILPPLMVALATGIIVTAFVVKRSRVHKYAAPFVFNVCVLLTFIASAEIYRYHLMSRSLLDHVPDHFQSSSFLNSVLSYRTYFRGPHASFDENGKMYRWSYSERRFFQVQ